MCLRRLHAHLSHYTATLHPFSSHTLHCTRSPHTLGHTLSSQASGYTILALEPHPRLHLPKLSHLSAYPCSCDARASQTAPLAAAIQYPQRNSSHSHLSLAHTTPLPLSHTSGYNLNSFTLGYIPALKQSSHPLSSECGVSQ